MPALRAESIVRTAQHDRDCARDCGHTFVCAFCKRRFGRCLRVEKGAVRQCVRCFTKVQLKGRG